MDEFSNDSSLDPDGDGYTNLQEFLLGTDPNVIDNPISTTTTTEISTTTSEGSVITTTIVTDGETVVTTSTVTTQGTETITKTAEGFGLVLLGLSFVAFVFSRRKK